MDGLDAVRFGMNRLSDERVATIAGVYNTAGYEETMALAQEVQLLRQVIREVHSQHADDICWLDIDKIFEAVGLPVPDRSVGNKEAMLKNCKRFLDIMCSGGKWKSYAELEAEVSQLRQNVSLLCHTVSLSHKLLDYDLERMRRLESLVLELGGKPA